MWLLASLLLAAAALAVSYWGAGLLVRPPKMSAMEVFPEKFGVAYENVSFRAADGHRLTGWFVPSPSGDVRTVVVCHGWGDNKGYILERTLFLNRRLGANVFYFDFRGHGESDTSLVTMGKLELRDLCGALDWLRAEKPALCRGLAVFGLSMGASVTALALASRPDVSAAVLESPFADYHQVGGRWAWDHFRVPYFPMVLLVMLWARLRSGHRDVDAYSPAAAIGAARTPVLFIAGERDTLMPPADVARLRAAHGGPNDFWVVPGAVHGKCYETAPAELEARVAAFLTARLAPASSASR